MDYEENLGISDENDVKDEDISTYSQVIFDGNLDVISTLPNDENICFINDSVVFDVDALSDTDGLTKVIMNDSPPVKPSSLVKPILTTKSNFVNNELTTKQKEMELNVEQNIEKTPQKTNTESTINRNINPNLFHNPLKKVVPFSNKSTPEKKFILKPSKFNLKNTLFSQNEENVFSKTIPSALFKRKTTQNQDFDDLTQNFKLSESQNQASTSFSSYREKGNIIPCKSSNTKTFTYSVENSKAVRQKLTITINDPYCALKKFKDCSSKVSSLDELLNNLTQICKSVDSEPCKTDNLNNLFLMENNQKSLFKTSNASLENSNVKLSTFKQIHKSTNHVFGESIKSAPNNFLNQEKHKHDENKKKSNPIKDALFITPQNLFKDTIMTLENASSQKSEAQINFTENKLKNQHEANIPNLNDIDKLIDSQIEPKNRNFKTPNKNIQEETEHKDLKLTDQSTSSDDNFDLISKEVKEIISKPEKINKKQNYSKYSKNFINLFGEIEDVPVQDEKHLNTSGQKNHVFGESIKSAPNNFLNQEKHKHDKNKKKSNPVKDALFITPQNLFKDTIITLENASNQKSEAQINFTENKLMNQHEANISNLNDIDNLIDSQIEPKSRKFKTPKKNIQEETEHKDLKLTDQSTSSDDNFDLISKEVKEIISKPEKINKKQNYSKYSKNFINLFGEIEDVPVQNEKRLNTSGQKNHVFGESIKSAPNNFLNQEKHKHDENKKKSNPVKDALFITPQNLFKDTIMTLENASSQKSEAQINFTENKLMNQHEANISNFNDIDKLIDSQIEPKNQKFKTPKNNILGETEHKDLKLIDQSTSSDNNFDLISKDVKEIISKPKKLLKKKLKILKTDQNLQTQSSFDTIQNVPLDDLKSDPSQKSETPRKNILEETEHKDLKLIDQSTSSDNNFDLISKDVKEIISKPKKLLKKKLKILKTDQNLQTQSSFDTIQNVPLDDLKSDPSQKSETPRKNILEETEHKDLKLIDQSTSSDNNFDLISKEVKEIISKPKKLLKKKLKILKPDQNLQTQSSFDKFDNVPLDDLKTDLKSDPSQKSETRKKNILRETEHKDLKLIDQSTSSDNNFDLISKEVKKIISKPKKLLKKKLKILKPDQNLQIQSSFDKIHNVPLDDLKSDPSQKSETPRKNILEETEHKYLKLIDQSTSSDNNFDLISKEVKKNISKPKKLLKKKLKILKPDQNLQTQSSFDKIHNVPLDDLKTDLKSDPSQKSETPNKNMLEETEHKDLKLTDQSATSDDNFDLISKKVKGIISKPEKINKKPNYSKYSKKFINLFGKIEDVPVQDEKHLNTSNQSVLKPHETCKKQKKKIFKSKKYVQRINFVKEAEEVKIQEIKNVENSSDRSTSSDSNSDIFSKDKESIILKPSINKLNKISTKLIKQYSNIYDFESILKDIRKNYQCVELLSPITPDAEIDSIPFSPNIDVPSDNLILSYKQAPFDMPLIENQQSSITPMECTSLSQIITSVPEIERPKLIRALFAPTIPSVFSILNRKNINQEINEKIVDSENDESMLKLPSFYGKTEETYKPNCINPEDQNATFSNNSEVHIMKKTEFNSTDKPNLKRKLQGDHDNTIHKIPRYSLENSIDCTKNALLTSLKYLWNKLLTEASKPCTTKNPERKTLTWMKNKINNYASDKNPYLASDAIARELNNKSNIHIAKFILEILLNDEELPKVCQNNNLFFMTSLQKKFIMLIDNISHYNQLFEDVILTKIETTVCNFTSDNMVEIKMSLAQIHTLICKKKGYVSRSRALLFDVLYTKALKAYPIVHKILVLWPNILPNYTENEEYLLNYTIAQLIIKIPSCWKISEYIYSKHALCSLKKVVFCSHNYYKMNYNYDELFYLIIDKIMLKRNDLALILLSKCQGFEWTISLLERKIMPILNDWENVEENLLARLVVITGKICGGFPHLDTVHFVHNIIKIYEKILQTSSSIFICDATVEGLVMLKEHNLLIVAKVLASWKPKSNILTQKCVENIKSVLILKHIKYWNYFVDTYSSKE